MQEGCPNYSYYWRLLVENQTKYQQGSDFFTLSRGPAYRLPMPLFYLSVQVIETSILIN
jgi:hypothetical protein